MVLRWQGGSEAVQGIRYAPAEFPAPVHVAIKLLTQQIRGAVVMGISRVGDRLSWYSPSTPSPFTIPAPVIAPDVLQAA